MIESLQIIKELMTSTGVTRVSFNHDVPAGEDLFQFQTTVLYCYRDSDESSVAGTTHMTPDEGQYVVDPPVRIAPEDYHRMNDYIGKENI